MGRSAREPSQTFYFIPHTHWEGAVFQTREAYLDMGLPNILRALRLLREHPEYRFVLDQACYVEPFLRRYPEEAAGLRALVAEGRLAIAGGTDVMADVNMPGGESFVRQVLYGKGYFRRALGVDPTSSWQLDTFGHHAQMPQLLRLAGYRSFWFFRGVASWEVPAEFAWEGLDGSRIAAFWLPHGYAVTYGSPAGGEEFSAFLAERFALLAPFARGAERVGLAGADVCEPEVHVPERAAGHNRRPDRPFAVRLAVPAEYEAAVARRRGSLPVVTGELNPIFQGTYSSRIELKQWTRELEGLLTAAEKLGATLQSLGLAAGQEALWPAWEPALFNQAHDLMSGVMTDRVYEDTVRTYDGSRRRARAEVERRLEALMARVDTRGEGIPVVVYNPLGWERTDLVEVEVGFAAGDVAGVEVVGPDGQVEAAQVVESAPHRGGGLARARIAFVARQVPALGHTVYRVRPQALPHGAAVTSEVTGTVCLESGLYRVEVDGGTGAILAVRVRDGDWQVLRAPGNVVAMEEDRGDLWEPYRPLDGGSRIAMKEPHPAPGRAVLSTELAGGPATRVDGPVFCEVTASHPFGQRGHFATTVRLCRQLRRIEVRTRILNQEQFVRYRLLVPTALREGRGVHEIPFGALERPAGIEFPAQNWVDWGDGERGVALLNRGLPGNNADGGTLMLSLLRCTSIVAYGFGGGYEPGMSSDTGHQLGQERTFEYALVPHRGDWRAARVYRDGLEFNQPLMARAAARHGGDLPARWGFLTVSHPGVVVSALKPGEAGGVVLRVYEAAGRAVKGCCIALSVPVASARVANLMEDPGRALQATGGTVRVSLRPFEIRTIRVEVKPKRGTRRPARRRR